MKSRKDYLFFVIPKKQNSYRFPKEFVSKLIKVERNEDIIIFDNLEPWKYAWIMTYAFTGYGVIFGIRNHFGCHQLEDI